MKITWLGHSCFVLEEDGYRILTDPYEGVNGYPDLHAEAHAVFCSHDHHDHNYRKGVTLLPKRDCPFSIREIASFHDEARGALRGPNTIRCFTADGVTVCHLGDLGHLLNAEQVRKIGRADVLLIPVGGFFTIDPKQAKEVAEQLSPRCTVPMHYRDASCGLPEVGGVEPFLKQYAAADVQRLDGNTFEVTPGLPKILVPAYQKH